MVSRSHGITFTAGGRSSARRRVVTVAFVLLVCIGVPAAAGAQADPPVTVTESAGTYSVRAAFTVPFETQFVLAALTDYAAIPRFMPEVRSSTVVERSDDRVVVEQEAVARFLMFSKKVHLVLDVQQQGSTITFRDRCGKSFTRYEGAWLVVERDGRTEVTYRLQAQPAFDVPEFLLKRLLKRDADRMIERLKVEIGARARTSR
jgi:ribosome-associated toxin RatA of RatAB toxin-antitoxin module